MTSRPFGEHSERVTGISLYHTTYVLDQGPLIFKINNL